MPPVKSPDIARSADPAPSEEMDMDDWYEIWQGLVSRAALLKRGGLANLSPEHLRRVDALRDRVRDIIDHYEAKGGE